MSSVLKIQHLRLRNSFVTKNNVKTIWRQLADTSKPDSNKLVVQAPTNLVRFRVRRARPNDESKIHNFVLENPHLAWPGPFRHSSTKSKRKLLEDFVSRSLCQGHSLVAEQQQGQRWGLLRGLALSTSLCAWDAALLEQWARCVRCEHFRRLLALSAHCLRAPGLHHKYSVHNILQIVLMVPPGTPKAEQIAQVLARTSIQRGRDLGFSVMRFDVTSDLVNTTLNNLKLIKEWEFCYKIISKEIVDNQEKEMEKDSANESTEIEKKIVVYTAFPTLESKGNEIKKTDKPESK